MRVVVVVERMAAVVQVDFARAQACQLRLAPITPLRLAQVEMPETYLQEVVLAITLFSARSLLLVVVAVDQMPQLKGE